MYGKLYLIPCTLGDISPQLTIPQHTLEIAQNLKNFIVEHPKTARQFLNQLKLNHPMQSLQFSTLNKHTSKNELTQLLAPLLQGEDVGVLSEAGCPGIADPGADLVQLAQEKNIPVIPLIGPCSIILSLMASGLNGQCFAFHGYLPVEEKQLKDRLTELEKESKIKNQTQIFIETPFRNEKIFQSIIQNCQPNTLFCIACDLTLASEMIITKKIGDWKKTPLPDINKRPTVFLFLAK